MDHRIEKLFEGWQEALVWSGLQGCMGYVQANCDENPTAAMVYVGDFCFFAGKPDAALFKGLQGFKLLIPKDEAWEHLIEEVFGREARRCFRYAIKKEPDIFDREKLSAHVKGLDQSYQWKLFDREIFQMAQEEEWSRDLCSQFADYEDYEKRAVGVAVLHQGKLVSGASPYAVYRGGIEIEIDTKPEYRNKGLATVCGARLILECLDRNLYPSWDAHDLRSVALAQKLGYHMDHSYITYEVCIKGEL